MREASTFWARRRAAVQAEAEADERDAVAEQDRVALEALAEKDDAEILAEMGLPDPLSMQKGDDFSVFMPKTVPEHLRRQALRTLWRSNPVLACVDGLNDYDEDFTKIGVLKEPIKTAYQVGKGMMAHIQEMERLALQDAATTEDEDVLPHEVDTAEDVQVVLTQTAPEEIVEAADVQEPDQMEPTPRRMRFHFQETTV